MLKVDQRYLPPLAPNPANSKRTHFWKQVFNFKVTVLRVYWELGARTGTKIKLVVSTFTFWKHFLFSKQISSPNLDKPFWLWIGFPINFTGISDVRWGLIDENPKMRHQDLRYRHPPPTVSGRVPRAQLVWIWAPNSTSALCPGYTTQQTVCWVAYRRRSWTIGVHLFELVPNLTFGVPPWRYLQFSFHVPALRPFGGL